jgi:hypothetical protein
VSISIVNGYLCNNSCDVAKARAGQDPHPRSETNQTPNAKPDAAQTPAVTFGGSLAGQKAVTPVQAPPQAGAANSDPPPARLDIRA